LQRAEEGCSNVQKRALLSPFMFLKRKTVQAGAIPFIPSAERKPPLRGTDVSTEERSLQRITHIMQAVRRREYKVILLYEEISTDSRLCTVDDHSAIGV
jgi:hypothetical protein